MDKQKKVGPVDGREKKGGTQAVTQVSSPGVWPGYGQAPNIVALFDRLQDAIVGLDRDLNVVYWNPAVEKVLGWTANEMTGLSAVDVLAPGCPRDRQEAALRQLVTQQPYHYVGLCHGAHARLVEIEVTAAAIAAPGGELQGYAVTLQDRGAKKQSARPAARKSAGQPVQAAEDRTVFRLDQALHEEEERFMLALQAASMVAWEWESGGEYITLHGNFSGLYGLTEPILVSDLLAMVHPEDRAHHMRDIARLLHGRKMSYDAEFRVVHPQHNEPVWLEEWCVAQRGEDGKVIKLVGVARNITRRKKAELALLESIKAQEEIAERFRTSVESLLDGFAIFSAVRQAGRIVDFRYEYINETGCRMNNRTYEEQVGHSLLELLPAHKENGLFERYVHVVETGDPLLSEDQDYEDIFGGGKRLRRSFEARAVKLRDGFVLTWRDISERKQNEEQIRMVTEKLKQSNRDLEQFAFVASHDLQEPLRKIRMFSRSLRRVMEDSLPEDAADHLDRMQNAAERMQAMIDGLLELSRASTRDSSYAPVDLDQLAREVVSDLEARIRTSGGQVVVQPLPTIEADALQMRQLLQNLIGNALKFHQPGVPPQVTVSAEILPPAPGKKRQVALSVADNGIGFEPEYFERILQPFQRLHGRNEYEGSGFGLAICKRIVERHQGQIAARSQPGKGATFIVTLNDEGG